MQRFKPFKARIKTGDIEEWIYYWSMYDRNNKNNLVDAGKEWCKNGYPKELSVLQVVPVTYEELKNHD